MTKMNVMDASNSSAITCKEAQILLNNTNLSQTYRNLLVYASNKHPLVECNDPKRTHEAPEHAEAGNKKVELSSGGHKRPSKPLSCSILMNLVFQEHDIKDVEEHVGKPLKIKYGKIFIFDEASTIKLNSTAPNDKGIKGQMSSIDRRIPHSKPPPLPSKPTNLLSSADQLETFQNFPIHKTVSLVDSFSSKKFGVPDLPRRNPPSARETPPIPPARTTSRSQPGVHASEDHFKESVVERHEERNVLRLKRGSTKMQSSASRTNSVESSLNETHGFVPPAILSFTRDDVPFVDAPGSRESCLELSAESLRAEDPIGHLRSIFPPPSFQFNSLPRTFGRTENIGAARSSHGDPESTTGNEFNGTDSGEDLDHYEKISQNESDEPGSSRTKILRRNELVVIDPNFFDFELLPRKHHERDSNRLLKSLFHQYDVLDEALNNDRPEICERPLTTACDREGTLYFLPRYALKNSDDFTGEAWYYPLPLTLTQATCFMRGVRRFGSFMVFQSTNEGGVFYLSVCVPDEVIHYRIELDEYSNYCIEGSSRRFPRLKDLVEFYRENRDSLVSRLKRSVKESNAPISSIYRCLSMHELNRNEIQFSGSVLGVGHFGAICVGSYNNQKVDVEVLRADDKNCEDCDQFDREESAQLDKEESFLAMASVLASLDHSNVVKLIGVSCRLRPYMLVSEHSNLGSLVKFLKRNEGLELSAILDVCRQMASALSHLASKTFVIHRNVNCSSFLVFEGLNIKLTGFQKARKVSADVYISSLADAIPVKWSPPEVLIDQVYSTKSDIWSLGMSMWQVFTDGEDPYDETSVEDSVMRILAGEVPNRPERCPKSIYSIIAQCWKMRMLDRPCAASLGRVLDERKIRCREEERSVADEHSLNSTSIPEHEAPAVGIVRLRKTFFSQKSSDKQTANARSSPVAPGRSSQPRVKDVNRQITKDPGKGVFERIFSMSDLTLRNKTNEGFKKSLRAEHSKSFQAE